MIDSLIIAFSTYSKIPMPKADWNEKSMKYAMCFFPVVGLVIAGLEFLVWHFIGRFQTYNIFTAFLMLMIPIAVTGGIHLDGLFDTEDALHSYGDKEKKLAILKDPHVGAFAVIYGVMYMLGAFALCTAVNGKCVLSMCFGFLISRELSGLSVVCFKKAKKDGMVSTIAENSDRIVKLVLVVYLIFTVADLFMFFSILGRSLLYPAATTFAAVVSFLWYRYRIVPEFGGTTGDLCGYFLCNCEFLMLLFNVLVSWLF
ncbi:hypothetical protein BXO88_05355 [Oribacterium sp. C9]|uniref:adenosylcobinamide-GDP ribazoletransferase n=1 Tax=Oribacterium sp. C9 TaxID=1943579 RepID=UPI00098FA2CE|nr:adenosylcobinamide-GDP ribazoletransferase [Oribacterium sp. C9]OON86971.1 hypothetical protein BXO88_05355 [Oribacterium sp. C9]